MLRKLHTQKLYITRKATAAKATTKQLATINCQTVISTTCNPSLPERHGVADPEAAIPASGALKKAFAGMSHLNLISAVRLKMSVIW